MTATTHGDRMNATPMSLAGGRFWLLWTLACGTAFAVGGPLGVALTSADQSLTRPYLAFGLGAVIAGALQAVLLRRVAPVRGWIPASLVMVAVMGAYVYGVGTIDVHGGLWGIALFAPAIGVVQWRLLRRHFDKAGWWVLASSLGWTVGGFLIGAEYFDMELQNGMHPGHLVGWAVFGISYGAVTGLALARLLRARRRESS